MARPTGFEPVASAFGGQRKIHRELGDINRLDEGLELTRQQIGAVMGRRGGAVSHFGTLPPHIHSLAFFAKA